MILKQFYLGCLSHASYIIADEKSGEAIIVDPQRDIDTYAPYLAEHGLHVIASVLTHFHADFIAGHIEFKERFGIPIYLGAAADADFDFKKLADGDILSVGSVMVKVLATPGHTPEGISLIVHDESGRAHAVLTGDTLFIGDVGRPDLLASVGVSAQDLGEMLYDSLRFKLMTLADDVLVYPAHGAGSLCGKNLSNATVSTIGEQRQHNYALQDMSKEDFIQLVTAEQVEAPAYFLYDAELNKSERQTMSSLLEKSHRRMSVSELRERAQRGEQIVDIRGDGEVHNGYFAAACNIGLSGKYATWTGSVLSTQSPISLITHDDDHEEAIIRLGRIGFDNVAGYILWSELKPDLLEVELQQTQQVLGQQLAVFLAERNPTIIDIRSPKEFATGHFERAENIPLGTLRKVMQSRDRSELILVHCAGGYRSSAAVTLLQSMGFHQVFDLAGGLRPEYLDLRLPFAI